MIGKKINQLATELAPASTDLTIIGNPTTGVSKKITLAQLGAIFSGAVSFYTNYAAFPTPGTTDVIYCAKDTKKLYLWSGSAYVEVFPSQALLDTYQLRSEKGNANGYASLDSSGKVPVSQLPSSIMEYKGTWSAATNTPTLANGTGDTGDVYICNAAGSVNFGAGAITFAVGDYVIYSGSIWQRSSGAVGTVTSVAASITGNAIGITGSPVTTSGTLALAFAGTSAQYVNGAGNLVTFPSIISQAQNIVSEVYNNTGATLTKGTIVYINGGQGNLPTVTKALATGDSTSAQTYGIVQADITNMNNGYVVIAGRLIDLDTQAYSNGTQLYLSGTTAGTWTSTKPYAPIHLVYVGIVVRAHPTQGVVEVKIQNGYEMDELHNVSAQNPNNGDILQYVSSTSLWTKVAGTTSNIAEGSNLYYTDARSRAALSFTAGSGAYNSTTGVITIPTNTNQLTNGAAYITLASLSAGAGISYNNTTGVIASTITQYTDAMARASISGGTGISYNSTTGVITNTITQYTDAMARASISLTTTGTSGAATYNSTTGVLNIPNYAPDLSGYVPTSRTLTINGTAYDLSANRSWSVGTVTSVGLSSSTSGVTIGSTPITTSGTITLAIATASGSQQGLLSSTDWTTFNNKQNALTNPVTGTGTTNYLPKFTGTSTIGNSQVFDNGTNVGIGTATPSYKLDVNGAARINNLLWFTPSSGLMALGSNGTNLEFYNGAGAETRLTLTNTGNLGLGVTPSAWGTYRAIDIGIGGSVASTDYENVIINSNGYNTNNLGWKYRTTGYRAALYEQYAGAHIWSTAIAGTAGNAISFTQAMTLNASGNLSIGNTNDTYKLDVLGPDGSVGTIRWANAGGRKSGFLYSDSAGVAIYDTNLNDAGIYLAGNTKMDFRVNGSIRLEIASTGASTFSSSVSVNSSASNIVALDVSGNTGNGVRQRFLNQSSSGLYNFQIGTHISAANAFEIGASSATDGTSFNNVFKILNTGAATFSSSIENVITWSRTSCKNWSLSSDSAGGYFKNTTDSVIPIYMTNAGNVGIGSASPNRKLVIQGTYTSNEQLLYLKQGDDNGFSFNLDASVTGNLLIKGVNSGTETSSLLTIRRDNGNVGIGVTSPSDMLHIGTTTTGGNLRIVSSGYGSNGLARFFGTDNSEKLQIGALGTNESFLYTPSGVSFLMYAGGTERMRITSGGLVGIGTSSPSEKLEVNGNIKASNLYSGTYTPTITLVTNAASSTAYVAQYYRVGNVVTVSGVVTVAASSANTNTRITMSIPINSNFDYSYRAGGGGGGRATSTVCVISASGSASTIQMDFVPTNTGSTDYFFSYTYQIL